MDKLEKGEYEIQHFEFTTEQLSLERRHFLNKTLSMGLQSMVDKFARDKPSCKELLLRKKEEIRRGILEDMEKHLQAIETLDRKNFCIPEYVLLATDIGHTNQYTEADEKKLDDEIETLRQRFLENSVMIESLRAENANYETIATQLKDELSLLERVPRMINETEMVWMQLSDAVKGSKNLLKKN